MPALIIWTALYRATRLVAQAADTDAALLLVQLAVLKRREGAADLGQVDALGGEGADAVDQAADGGRGQDVDLVALLEVSRDFASAMQRASGFPHRVVDRTRIQDRL